MLSRQDNELLTRVGAETPMGALLRRYWWPIAPDNALDRNWTRRVRLLGENLVLFKTKDGEVGLIEESCPHRRASLAYGILESDGIRCPYHGWKFDGKGRCIDQPFETGRHALAGKVATAAYPVQRMGGLFFAYLGPAPMPLLPRYDAFVADNAIRLLGIAEIPVNWLQVMENSLDPVHAEWLHGHLHEFITEAEGKKVAASRSHEKIAFDEFEYGIIKRRLLRGQSEDSDDWRVGHPVVFPHILAVGNANEHERNYSFQIRVPVDDTHTLHFWYSAFIPPASAKVPKHLLANIHAYDVPIFDDHGEHIIDFVDGQDMMAWISQGAIFDRSTEALGASDKGIVIFRNMLKRELARMQNGEDPKGVIRDQTRNGRIDLPVEKGKHHFSDGMRSRFQKNQLRYCPVFDELLDVFDTAQQERRRLVTT